MQGVNRIIGFTIYFTDRNSLFSKEGITLLSKQHYTEFSNWFLSTDQQSLAQEIADFSPDVIFPRNMLLGSL